MVVMWAVNTMVLTLLHSSIVADVIPMDSPITRAGSAMINQMVSMGRVHTKVLILLHSSNRTDVIHCSYLWTQLPCHMCRFGFGYSGCRYWRSEYRNSDIVTQQWHYRCNIYLLTPLPGHTCRSGYAMLDGSYLRIWYHGSDSGYTAVTVQM